KPVLRIAPNSAVDSAEPQVPLSLISAIRARAAEGRPVSLPRSATRGPLRSVPAAFTIPACTERTQPPCPAPCSVPVLGVPFFVATAHGLQPPFRLLLGGVRPEPVLGRAAFFGFDRVMPEAIPPAVSGVHAD